jgi:hypothetical protein
MDIVGDAKMIVDGAATAAQKLDDFAKSSEKALAEGKTLNLFQEAVHDVTLFSKANIALQCLSMGLKAIGMLIGGEPSQEAQILEGITQVLGRIDTLSKDLDQKFAQVAKKLDLQTGKLELQSHLTDILTAKNLLAQINDLKTQGRDFSTIENQLTMLTPVNFYTGMVQIRNSCEGNATSPNVLSTLYDLSYGDVKAVWAMGEYLLQNATMALMLHGIVAEIRYKKGIDKDKVDHEEIASLYEKDLKAVADAVTGWTQKCLSNEPNDRPTQIRLWLDANKSVVNILASDRQGTSQRIADGLQAHYPYLNFSVIVYEPVTGFNWHGMTGSSYLTAFRYPDVIGKAVNIIIYWADRTPTNRQAIITYKSATAEQSNFQGTQFQGARKDRSFDASVFRRPNRPSGDRYQFVYDFSGAALAPNHTGAAATFYGRWGNYNKDLKPILDQFGAEANPARREAGSLLWCCFTDDYDNYEQSYIGLTSYNALYGVLSSYTCICFWADPNDTNQVELQRSDGHGHLTLLNGYGGWRRTFQLIVPGNFGGNGYTDLLFYDPSRGESEFYKANGNGNLTRLVTNTGWRKSWEIIVPGNFGGNGYTDLLFYDPSQGEGEFYKTDGNGNLTYLSTNPGWRKSWKIIVPGNFGGNGYTDLLFYDPSRGEGEFYTTDGSGNLFLLKSSSGWRKSWKIIVPGNFSGNGYTDLLFYDPSRGESEFYTTDGNGNLTRLVTNTGWRKSWEIIVPGNFGGNSYTDLLFYDPSQGEGEFYTTDGMGNLQFLATQKIQQTCKLIAPRSDLAGNGYTDLLFYSPAN